MLHDNLGEIRMGSPSSVAPSTRVVGKFTTYNKQDRHVASTKYEQEVVNAVSSGDVSDDLERYQLSQISHIFTFWSFLYVLETAEARDVKFCTQVDIKYQPSDDELPPPHYNTIRYDGLHSRAPKADE